MSIPGQFGNFHFLFFFLIFLFYLISWRLITLQYCSGFCHTLTWISLGYTCIPHPDPPSQGTFIFNEASHSGSSSPSSLSLSSAARFSYYPGKNGEQCSCWLPLGSAACWWNLCTLHQGSWVKSSLSPPCWPGSCFGWSCLSQTLP